MDRRSLLFAVAGLVACAGPSVRSDLQPDRSADSGPCVVSFEVQATNGKGTFSLLPGTPLQSEDRLAVLAETTQPAFVYVGHRQAARPPSVIFPEAGREPLLLQPGETKRIPAAGQWFQLDAQVGEETIYLFASAKKLDASEAQKFLLARVESSAIQTREPPPVMTERNRGAKLASAMSDEGLSFMAFPISHR